MITWDGATPWINKRIDLDAFTVWSGPTGKWQASDDEDHTKLAEVGGNQLLDKNRNKIEGEEECEDPEGNTDLYLVEFRDVMWPESETRGRSYQISIRTWLQRQVKLWIWRSSKDRQPKTKAGVCSGADYVFQEHGENLGLMVNCLTCWNNLLTMPSRFQQLRVCRRPSCISRGQSS